MYVRRNNPHGVGRKGYFKDDMVERAYELCLLGLRNTDLAMAFGVGVGTIDYWMQHKPLFANAVRRGRLEADGKVAKAMYQKAIGYSHRDHVILTNRVTEYNEDGKPVKSYNEPLIVPIIKHLPPDAYACNKWLAARQREYWAEVQKVDHTHTFQGKVDVNHIMDQISDKKEFTDEELKVIAKMGLKQIQQTLPAKN